MKKLRIYLLILVIFSSTFISTDVKAAIVQSGNLGALGASGITWTLDSNGLLTVSGSGTLSNIYPTFPWLAYKTSIKTAIVTVTSINTAYGFFSDCVNLTSVNLSGFNTSNVTNMAYMFYGCKVLTSVNLSNFNTINVTDMASMFAECQTITTINIISFNTSNVTDMSCMFSGCNKLVSLDVSKFNTSKVSGFGYMFEYCASLTSLNVSSFDTSSAYEINGMFRGAGISSIDLGSFRTELAIDISSLFEECVNLTYANLINFDTSNADIGWMFSGCNNITINTTDIQIRSYDFSGMVVYFPINYVLNGGTNNGLNTPKYTNGVGVSLSNPSKTGYTFSGWYSNIGLTTPISSITTASTGTITVYAKWTANKYSITYNLNGGINNASNLATYTYGVGLTLVNPTKTGYTFNGWYTNSGLTTQITNISTTSAVAVVVYAKWTANSYAITYNLNSGTNNASNLATYSYGVGITFTSPTRAGYTFGGWYTDSGLTASITSISTTSMGVVTVYAKWTILNYNLTVNPNGGIWNGLSTASIIAQSPSSTKAITNATRTGYSFTNWTLSGLGSFSGGVYTYGLGNGTLTANWAKILVSSITLNKIDKMMSIGGTFALVPTVLPSTALNTSVTWSSGNSLVASVNSSGLVTAISGGQTLITATANDGSGVTASCVIYIPTFYVTIPATVFVGTDTSIQAVISNNNSSELKKTLDVKLSSESTLDRQGDSNTKINLVTTVNGSNVVVGNSIMNTMVSKNITMRFSMPVGYTSSNTKAGVYKASAIFTVTFN